jgi:hypothetical protein
MIVILAGRCDGGDVDLLRGNERIALSLAPAPIMGMKGSSMIRILAIILGLAATRYGRAGG